MTENEKKELVAQAQQMPEKALAIARQLKLMVTNGQKLTNEEVMTLANFAYHEGLDPLNGECWILKKKDGPTIGCMVGIKGLRRKATQALGTEDVWYPEFKDITQTYDQKDETILYAYECTIRNTRATARWLTLQNGIDRKNYTAEQIIDIFGHPPMWTGLGVVHKGEYMPANYPPTTKAKKRAEAAAINAMMGFGYSIMDDDNVVDGEVRIEGQLSTPIEVMQGEVMPDYTETPDETELVIIRLQKNAESKRLKSKKQGDWTQGRRGALIGVIETMTAPGDATEKRHELIQALFGRTSFSQLEWYELETLEEWVKAQKTADGKYLPDPAAQQEMDRIMAKLAKRPGQQDLFSGNAAE